MFMPKLILMLALMAPLAMGAVAGDEEFAKQLLLKALENQFRGRYQAKLDLIEDSFSKGRDSLSGKAEFAADLGERQMTLSSPRKSFEYRSLDFGKEQWVVDGNSQRIRRIANRQWKKGVFGSLLTYEDMLKFPMDFLLEFSTCKSATTTDSTYRINMTLKPAYQTFYSRLDVTLSKEPVLLKSITFYGMNDKPLKSMDVTGYQKVSGQYLVSDLSVVDCDSTASLKMCFRNFSFPESSIARNDKLGKAGGFNLFSRLTDILPKGPEAAANQKIEEDLDASN